MKRVLIVAYHFPPISHSSGYLRTLKFAEYLPAVGYEPFVLTVHKCAYPSTDEREVPFEIKHARAFAIDVARHLAIAGRYPEWLARPDRWGTWSYFGSLAGKRIIESFRPDVILSTYPIASAHSIGLKLARKTGVPWVADFRDPMTEEDFPTDATVRRRLLHLEKQIIAQSSANIFTTASTRDMYRSRYPHVPKSSFYVIPNGFDERDFEGLNVSAESDLGTRRLILLHSGTVYPSERDPRALFAAVRLLRDRGTITVDNFELRLRATAHDTTIRQMARDADVSEFINLQPPFGYRAAIQEMLSVSALLILQAANCNRQIPAKVYEYMRAARPILALTDKGGDTAKLLKRSGSSYMAGLDDSESIATELTRLLTDLRAGTASSVPDNESAKYTRAVLTEKLSRIFDGVTFL